METDKMKKGKTPDTIVALRIILIAPPSGVDFGVQEGKGHDYKTIQIQRSKRSDLRFEFRVTVKGNRDDGLPNFAGALVQGPPAGRFICIDIGKLAGQTESEWERRIKIPLTGITLDMIEELADDPKRFLEARFPGTGKDGGPSCATVKPIDGWKVNVK
jgi:hypothetical protein